MKLYKAVDKLDNTESFFLVYPSGEVATMADTVSIDKVKFNQNRYFRDPAWRFKQAINPVLVEEWD